MGSDPNTFYITLFSNSSMKDYPNNTLAHLRCNWHMGHQKLLRDMRKVL